MNIAPSSAYFMGFASLSVGLLALITPSTAADVFGVSLASQSPSPSTSQSAALAFLVAKGARDITLGISYFALGYRKQFGAVRVLMMAHAMTGAVDALVVGMYGVRRKAWGHAVGTAALVVFLASGVAL
jgi:hypothetical protein